MHGLKKYVEVETSRSRSGELSPKSIRWHDGRTWKINKILHVCTSPDAELEGIRYTILIGSAEKYIYRLGDRWYVNSE
jgi:hypothetical protein